GRCRAVRNRVSAIPEPRRAHGPRLPLQHLQPHAEHAKKTRCLHGCLVMRSRGRSDGTPMRFEAGLRWLTDRWPGGTIGNEAEVYSGYYTEAASVSQAY